MFLKTFTVKKGEKEYKYYSVVESIWNNGKPTYKTILYLGAIPKRKAELIKEILVSDNPTLCTLEEVFPKKSYEFLSSAVLDFLFSYWDLDKVLSPIRNKDTKFSYIEIVKGLVINRSLAPCSKLQMPNWYKETFLPKLDNVPAKELDENLIYRVMDALLPLEESIQKHLYYKIREKHPKSFRLVFYDLTSSYFEGTTCKLAKRGYSRDHRPDNLQIVLGLVVTEEGFPFYWKIFPGNTVDITTLKGTIDKLKELFSISSCAIVSDRGLVSTENISDIQGKIPYIMLSDLPKEEKNLIFKEASGILSSYTEKNLQKKVKELFPYSDKLYYKELSFFNGQRNILCFDTEKYVDDKKYRENMLKKVENYFNSQNDSLLKAKRSRDYKKLDKQIDHYLKRKKVSRFFTYELIPKSVTVLTKKGVKEISTFQIQYSRNQTSIDKSAIFDGAYLLISDLKDKINQEYIFSPFELIKAYKRRNLIEQAFRVIKSFVRIRPIYHHLDDRVKAHVLICILSYLLDSTIEYLLQGKIDKEVEFIYNTLNECKLVEFFIQKKGDKQSKKEKSPKMQKITPPSEEQLKILQFLGCEHLVTSEYIKGLALKEH